MSSKNDLLPLIDFIK